MSWVNCTGGFVLGHLSWDTDSRSPVLARMSWVACPGSRVVGHCATEFEFGGYCAAEFEVVGHCAADFAGAYYAGEIAGVAGIFTFFADTLRFNNLRHSQ